MQLQRCVTMAWWFHYCGGTLITREHLWEDSALLYSGREFLRCRVWHQRIIISTKSVDRHSHGQDPLRLIVIILLRLVQLLHPLHRLMQFEDGEVLLLVRWDKGVFCVGKQICGRFDIGIQLVSTWWLARQVAVSHAVCLLIGTLDHFDVLSDYCTCCACWQWRCTRRDIVIRSFSFSSFPLQPDNSLCNSHGLKAS